MMGDFKPIGYEKPEIFQDVFKIDGFVSKYRIFEKPTEILAKPKILMPKRSLKEYTKGNSSC
jgi:hypothetical protein